MKERKRDLDNTEHFKLKFCLTPVVLLLTDFSEVEIGTNQPLTFKAGYRKNLLTSIKQALTLYN